MTFAVKGGSFLQYILFLQDVNVGGKNKASMSALKEELFCFIPVLWKNPLGFTL